MSVLYVSDMRKMRALSVLMAAALAVTSVAVSPSSSDAAKKIKLSKKSKTIAVSGSFTLKLKNGKKKAKVTWVVNKKGKSVVKLSKKVKAGNKASVKITGKKKGKATVTAKYKLGKAKVKKFNCKVTVKKAVTVTPTPAASGNAPVATSPAANGTAAPSSSATVTTNPIGNATATPTGGDDKPTVTKVPKPSKTPSPEPTPKETGKPAPTEKGGYFDILGKSYVVLPDSYKEGSASIKHTVNADGSQTLDFTGVLEYKGCRWYFGTKDADGTTHPENLDLSPYKFLVVEGINQTEGFGSKDTYDLVSQFLDGVQKADHGGPLEICSNNAFRFPIEMDLSDSALSNTDLSNVCAYEIYIPNKEGSKKVGPFTITGIKAFKDKAAYEAYQKEQGQTPKPTDKPIVYEKIVDADMSAANFVESENGGKGTYNAQTKTIDCELGSMQGVVINVPKEGQVANNKVEITYTLDAGDVSVYAYDDSYTGQRGQNDGSVELGKLAVSTEDKKAEFTFGDGKMIKALKIFNFGSSANLKIKSVAVYGPKADEPEIPERNAETLNLKKVEPATVLSGDKLVFNGDAQAFLPITQALVDTEEVDVKINGELAENHTAFRAWIGNGNNAGSEPVTINIPENGKFSKVITIKANKDKFAENETVAWNKLTIKEVYGAADHMKGITITKVEVAKKGTLKPDDVSGPVDEDKTYESKDLTEPADLDKKSVDLAKVTGATYADKKVVVDNKAEISFDLPKALKAGEKISVIVKGSVKDSTPKFIMSVGTGDKASKTFDPARDVFKEVIELTAGADATKLTFKKVSDNIKNFTITGIDVFYAKEQEPEDKTYTSGDIEEPAGLVKKSVDLSTVNDKALYDATSGTVTVADKDILWFDFPEALGSGDVVKVIVKGSVKESTSKFRAWAGDGNNGPDGANIVHFDPAKKVFENAFTLKAEGGNAGDYSKLTFKKELGGGNIKNFTITGIDVFYAAKPVVIAPKNVTIENAFVVDLSKVASFTDESVQFAGAASATYSYDEATGVATYELGKNLSGFSVVMPAGESYEKVEITYSRTKGENDKFAAFVYDSRFVGYGNGQPGVHEEALPASDDYTTVTYVPKNGYEGNCIKGLKIFNFAGGATGDASTLKIKSIKFFRSADTIPAKTYELADAKADSVISIANKSKYGIIGFGIGEFDSYVNEYASIYKAVEELYRKGGTVKKFLENGEVSYKASADVDGKGTFTIENDDKEFTADVTIDKNGKDITATFVSPVKKFVVSVNSDTPNVATVVKNDTETFKVTLEKDANGNYSVVAVSDQNKYVAVEKKDGNFSVTISDNYFDTYAPFVIYTK